jgi:hypothetical protein
MNLDDVWDQFMNGDVQPQPSYEIEDQVPISSELYISTNTVISYFTHPIPLVQTFWNIPLVPYSTPLAGVIKKQLKFNCDSVDAIADVMHRANEYSQCNVNVIHHSEMKGFRDVRKVSIGICKKDIVSKRVKKKGAFYNCFVLILRVLIDNVFKEFHVKVFLTGKIEIPGIQNTSHMEVIIDMLKETLLPFHPTLGYSKMSEQIVLINSNFSCGYFIHRNKLYQLLKFKYKISTVYDPCSYPGIQCKIYYNGEVTHIKQPIGISFMIFRTGSILIVGKCTEIVIRAVYLYLVDIMKVEYHNIVDKNCIPSKKTTKKKIKKLILIR